ncbi:hypothetical protein BGZ96_008200 [Linnemannia gamsii]|uniref:Arm-like repeat domain-containing protein n=1 Tax=Linnemannia gamsii TaxID=64522 RepID=A0ABQ7K041_9FUNG|nr:hypothetical protein BGZ96_008200 [Linnemannia gamsii]
MHWGLKPSRATVQGSHNRQKDIKQSLVPISPNKEKNAGLFAAVITAGRKNKEQLAPSLEKGIKKLYYSAPVTVLHPIKHSRSKHTNHPEAIMFGNKVSSKRSPLAPQRELRLVNIYLEQGRIASKAGEHQIALVLCEEAEASLSKMKKCVKAAEVGDVTDLRHGVACAFLELSKLLEELNQQERAKESGSKAHDWGYPEVYVEKLSILTPPSHETTVSITTQLPSEVSASIAEQPSRKTSYAAQPSLKTTGATQLPLKTTGSTAAQPPLETLVSVLTKPALDKLGPAVIEHKLPEPDERLVSTHQLVYCLGLLKAPPSSDDPHKDSVLHWVKSTRVDLDEQERLNTLTTKIVRLFLGDELKDPSDITEVACICPFLNRNTFRALLELFIDSTEKSNLLNLHALKGLAKLMQGANEGHLEADDLVRILQVLNTRLQATHPETQNHIYQLLVAVSRVLDAMADCKVEGLDRVILHERLSGYINDLKDGTDPHMVYLAAYAFQALECVPD